MTTGLRRSQSGMRRLLAIGMASTLIATGCGSSGAKSTGANGKTFTVGVLADMTGLAASGNNGTLQGVKAGIALAKSEGYTIHYVLADTASSPSQTLSAAQQLVEHDHVLAVITGSALAFAAAPFLARQHIPVIGEGADGSEWETDLNMFSIAGVVRPEYVLDIWGRFLKMEGGTNIGSIGYSISPSSSEEAKAVADSARHAGLKVGYENGSFPFGSTNVGPASIAMKNAGVNGLYGAIEANTEYSLVTSLRQLGANPVALFPTGYGADLEQGGPAAEQVAQGIYFTLGAEPVEMHTSATEEFQKYLSASGYQGEPSYSQYIGYASMGLLLRGLAGVKSKVTQGSLTTALSKVHDWDYVGLWGGRTMDINNRHNLALEGSPGNCTWIVRYSGTAFHIVPGASPICGSVIPGLTEKAG